MPPEKNVFDNVLDAIGRTPLVRLRRIGAPDGARIYAKLEFLNPGMSVKDRMALHIIQDAERRGLLRPGGIIVENTSGNTGVGVALCAAVKGYRAIFTMPDKMSEEKVRRLKAFGAEVVVCPTAVPADHPESYYETAKRIASETPGAFMLNQYHNKLNIEAHYHSTGPEVWEQTEGRLDAFVAGLGTGGTMSGVARFLKERKPAVWTVGVDPMGSVYFEQFHTGLPGEPHVYQVEGIGEDMVCDALEFDHIDDVFQVTDRECFHMARRLAREEGIFAGGSSGGAVHVAVEAARHMRPDQLLVVLLPDSGAMYLSKFFDDAWMEAQGHLGPEPEPTLFDVLRCRPHARCWVREETALGKAVARATHAGLDVLAVVDEEARPVGELSLARVGLAAARAREDWSNRPVRDWVEESSRLAAWDTPLAEAAGRLASGHVLFVVKAGRVVGAVTARDAADYLSARGKETNRELV